MEDIPFDFPKLTNTQEILDKYTEVIDEIQQNFFIKDEIKAKSDFFDEGPQGSNLGQRKLVYYYQPQNIKL